jgi:hypothetical protein
LEHAYKLYLDISADELSDDIFSGMRNTLKRQHKLKLQKNSSNASIVVRFATLSCTKTTSVYSRVLETAYEAGVEWEHLADYITQRGGIDKVRKAGVGVEKRKAASAAMHASRKELQTTLYASSLGSVHLAPTVTTVASADTEFYHLLCVRNYITGDLVVAASLYPSATLESDALHHYTIALEAATKAGCHGFNEHCESLGMNADMVLRWMAANNINDGAAAQLMVSQLKKVANDTYVSALAEAA